MGCDGKLVYANLLVPRHLPLEGFHMLAASSNQRLEKGKAGNLHNHWRIDLNQHRTTFCVVRPMLACQDVLATVGREMLDP